MAAVLDEHVIEQRPVVGLVDRYRTLHHLRCQPDLASLDFSTISDLQRDEGSLDRVGVLDRHVGIVQRQLADRRARLFGFVQPARDVVELAFGRPGHGLILFAQALIDASGTRALPH
jgi:hypothetical protein